MIFTRKEDYGVLFMKILAQSYDRRRWLPLREISEGYGLPLPFLKQLVRNLRQANLVVSKEGKNGGYKLSRNPKGISLGEIIRAINGPMAITQCYHELEDLSCDKESICPSRSILQKVGEEFILKLDGIKLG